MNKVRLTPEAVRDLEEIRRYISEELGNLSAARRIVESITENLRLLERHALVGPSVESLTGHPTNLYILVCGKYVAIYRAEGSIVSIARIVNARQDYIRVLFGDISPATEQNTENIKSGSLNRLMNELKRRRQVPEAVGRKRSQATTGA